MTDPTVAKYENETRQIISMKWILVTTIVAGTLLMMLSIVAPFIVLAFLHPLSPSLPQQTILTAAQQFTTAPRDVLPFATALVGFAGGVVTAMYRTGTAQGPPPQPSPGQGTAGQGTAVKERLVKERLVKERLVKEHLRSREFILSADIAFTSSSNHACCMILIYHNRSSRVFCR